MTKPTWSVLALFAIILFGSVYYPIDRILPSVPKAHAASLSFSLVGFISGWNFTSVSNPSITVSPGDSVNVALSSGDNAPHRFFIDVDRNGPAPNCPPDKCSSTFPPSTTYTFTVDFFAGTYTYYCAIHPNSMFGNFIVQSPAAPDFNIAATPASVSVVQGSSATSTINLASLNGFAGTVTVNSVSSPAGLPLSPATTMVTLAAGGTGSFPLTFSPTTSNAAGTYTVTATGTSGSLSHSATVAVTVVAPDFGISASAATPASLAAGNSATSTITLTSLNSFAGSVNLVASTTAPVTGLTFSFNMNPVTLPAGGTGTSTLTISTTTSTPVGTYTIMVTGTAMGGSPSHSATVAATVVGPDFSIASSPTTLSIVQGSSGNSTITLTSLNGFSGSVSLTATVSPSGPSATLNAPTVTLSPGTTGQSTVHVSTSSGIYATSTGTYTISVTGISGSVSHSATVTITVTSGTSSGTGNLPASVIIGVVVLVIAAAAVAVLAIRRSRPKKTEGPQR